MEDWTELIPVALVVIFGGLATWWASEREHEARVNRSVPYIRVDEERTTLDRYWFDETATEARRRGYPAARRFQ